MNTKSILGLAVMGLLLASCQSNSYQINGYALHLEEGDTILLAHDTEPKHPLAMTTISGGKFYMEETLDNKEPCRIYLKRMPECSALFFPDEGTVTIELCLPPTPSRISGTILNNEWQQMNDSIQHMGKKLIRIVEQQDSDSVAHMARFRVTDSLHRLMSNIIISTGKRNKDNPLGRFIQENYKEPEFK
jgi:hypothetical protein